MMNVALIGCGRISPCHIDAASESPDRMRIALACLSCVPYLGLFAYDSHESGGLCYNISYQKESQ